MRIFDEKIRQLAFESYTPPFKFDGMVYVTDAAFGMLCDIGGDDDFTDTPIAPRVRGWGRLAAMHIGAAAQVQDCIDSFIKRVAKSEGLTHTEKGFHQLANSLSERWGEIVVEPAPNSAN